ncbi:hypothetical protein ZWY2020_052463 [Hordeum vulgare]|nr:hypothetical protein ZWY2020_052463 [Hordeum vulgare]
MTIPRGRPTPRCGAGSCCPRAAARRWLWRHEGGWCKSGRKIGRSFFHTRYFVLDNKLLAYYKKQAKDNNMVGAYELLSDTLAVG